MNHRIAHERIAHETVDGEVVILDPANGTYYSLTGAGADVWAMLVAGASLERVAERFDADEATVREAVAALVAELSREELILPTESAGAVVADGARRPWVAPKLEKFTDLQGLLVLDPIHEVDEAGWPRPAREE